MNEKSSAHLAILIRKIARLRIKLAAHVFPASYRAPTEIRSADDPNGSAKLSRMISAVTIRAKGRDEACVRYFFRGVLEKTLEEIHMMQ